MSQQNTTQSVPVEASLKPALPVHAAIDIGTNSFHMVVARGLCDGGFEVITTEKEMVRLGQGSRDMSLLAPEAIARGVAALGRMAAVAKTHGAPISAVATSAVREAANRQVFIDRARIETGVEVQVISGFEEARLIHLGVLQALPVFDKRLLLVDIGGGSTEFLVGEGSTVVAARSIKLGAIRISDRFFPGGKVSAKQVAKCRVSLRSTLASAVHEIGSIRYDIAIGSSGTITAVAAMIAHGRGESPKDLNGSTFSAEELQALTERLTTASPDERRKMGGLDSRRVDLIVGGALLLEAVFEAFEVKAMTVSGFALREGVLFDRLASARPASADRLSDLRRSNVVRLARQLDPDATHAQTSAELALRVFDQTLDLHGLGQDARELMEMAAIVHNVGLFISHAAHHKHTYYVVRHSEQLTGFTERERELMALIARYHRRRHPTTKHAEFAGLNEADQDMVRKLAGILRIAIGLDRSHQALVTDVIVDFDKKDRRLLIKPVPESNADIDLEIYSAQERAELLAQVLEVEVVLEPEIGKGKLDERFEHEVGG